MSIHKTENNREGGEMYRMPGRKRKALNQKEEMMTRETGGDTLQKSSLCTSDGGEAEK